MDFVGDILSQVVAHPQYKLLNVQAIPHTAHRAKDYSTYSWTGLLKSLRQMLIANSHMEEGVFVLDTSTTICKL